MRKIVHIWLKGLISATVSGVAGSIGPMVAAPNEFNFGTGLSKLLTIAAVSGLIGLVNYLKDSPLPGNGKDIV